MLFITCTYTSVGDQRKPAELRHEQRKLFSWSHMRGKFLDLNKKTNLVVNMDFDFSACSGVKKSSRDFFNKDKIGESISFLNLSKNTAIKKPSYDVLPLHVL